MSELSRVVAQAGQARAERQGELEKMYAQTAAHPAGRQVLKDIMERLSDPDFSHPGVASRSDAFLARYCEASRIQQMIGKGQGR